MESCILCTASKDFKFTLITVPEPSYGDLNDLIHLLSLSKHVKDLSIPFRTPQKSISINEVSFSFHTISNIRALTPLEVDATLIRELKTIEKNLEFEIPAETQNLDLRIKDENLLPFKFDSTVERTIESTLGFHPYSLEFHPQCILNFITLEELSNPLHFNLETKKFDLKMFEKKIPVVFVLVDEIDDQSFLNFQARCRSSGFLSMKFVVSDVKKFLLSLSLDVILPFLEKHIASLTSDIQVLSQSSNTLFKSTFSSFNKLFKQPSEKEVLKYNVEISLTGEEKTHSSLVFFTSDSLEFKTLLLAEHYQNLGDFKTSLSLFKQLRNLYNNYVSNNIFGVSLNFTNAKKSPFLLRDEVLIYKAYAIFKIALLILKLRQPGYVKEAMVQLVKMQKECFQPLTSKICFEKLVPIFVRFQSYFVIKLSNLIIRESMSDSLSLEGLRNLFNQLAAVLRNTAYYESKLFSAILFQLAARSLLFSSSKDISSIFLTYGCIPSQVSSNRERKFSFMLLMSSSSLRQNGLLNLSIWLLLIAKRMYLRKDEFERYKLMAAHIDSIIYSALGPSLCLERFFHQEVNLSTVKYEGLLKNFVVNQDIHQMIHLLEKKSKFVRQDNASLFPTFSLADNHEIGIVEEPCWFCVTLQSQLACDITLINVSLRTSFEGSLRETAIDSIKLSPSQVKLCPFEIFIENTGRLIIEGLSFEMMSKQYTLDFSSPVCLFFREQSSWIGFELNAPQYPLLPNQLLQVELDLINTGISQMQDNLRITTSANNFLQSRTLESDGDEIGLVQVSEKEWIVSGSQLELGLPKSALLNFWFDSREFEPDMKHKVKIKLEYDGERYIDLEYCFQILPLKSFGFSLKRLNSLTFLRRDSDSHSLNNLWEVQLQQSYFNSRDISVRTLSAPTLSIVSLTLPLPKLTFLFEFVDKNDININLYWVISVGKKVFEGRSVFTLN